MTSPLNRRTFLKSAAGAGGSLLVLRDGRSARGAQANEKLNIAVVGVGNRGSWHANSVTRLGQNLVAICDVDSNKRDAIAQKHPKVAQFKNFRKMLDEMGDRIDAVIVVTTDHNHAVVATRSMKRGKHVYVEKPAAHDVSEARALRDIARREKVASQMGNQGMETDQFRRTLELIQDGAIGEIREAHVWFPAGGGGMRELPSGTPPVPDYLEWDLFLGPASQRPYHPRYVAGWGGWRDFGTGVMGGCGSHLLNLVFKGLDLAALWEIEDPSKRRIVIESEQPHLSKTSYPWWQFMTMEFPARGSLPPAKLHWYNASESELRKRGIWQKMEKIAGRPLDWQKGWAPTAGSLLVGAKGVAHTNSHNSFCELLPKEDFPKAGGPPQRLPHVEGHRQEWLAACKGGAKPISNFDHSGPVCELLMLGNVVSRVGEKLEYDPVEMRVVNNETADAILRPERREGWEL
jgi:hypothetical protein